VGVSSDGAAVFDVLGRLVAQVGIVVADLEAAVAAHIAFGPWSVYTYDRSAVPGLHDADGPAEYCFRIAINEQNPQLELIEALDDRSIYADWWDRGNRGLHHLGFLVDDVSETTAAMRAAGFAVLAGGTGHGADGSGGFCYYDTLDAVGYLTESIERPRRRRQPDKTIG